MKILLVLLFTVLGCSIADEITSNFRYEDTCTNGPGGRCVLETECHHPVDDKYKGLCPAQKHLGAVCCKDFPIEKLNCFQSHNDCRSSSQCPPRLQLGRKGCPGNKICCILL